MSHSIQDRPQWVQDAVFYAIFPDRFAKSDRVHKPGNLLAWDAAPTAEGYCGGDLLGIVEKLDYLQELGINAIYLTPVFQSACNHRYHTHDYFQVDPLLGGNEALRELVEQLHARDMRIILDGVFNHCSRGFFRFNDILENGPHSPWLDWFFIEKWPVSAYDGAKAANYVGWVNNRALPKFRTDNPAVREYLMQVAEFWIREYDIDGWRLDVPTEITTAGFWEEFRQRVRTVKSDAYLVGEIWHDAPDWLAGDRFDATMNYVFAAAAIAFAGGERISGKLVGSQSYEPYPGIDAPTFGDRINALLDTYAWETTQVQFNLLGSHDAPRVLSLARGDKATLRLATFLQMTFPGAPTIYYGDEIALRGTKRYERGHRDQDARWPFPWHDESQWDRETLDFAREAIALRHGHPALRQGTFTPVYAKDQQFAFLRTTAEESLLVAVNAGDETATIDVTLPENHSEIRALFGKATATPREGGAGIEIPSRSGAVFGL